MTQNLRSFTVTVFLSSGITRDHTYALTDLSSVESADLIVQALSELEKTIMGTQNFLVLTNPVSKYKAECVQGYQWSLQNAPELETMGLLASVRAQTAPVTD